MRSSPPVGLLSSWRETYFYLPRNKDKSGTRTNDIRDRSFQLKRSARQVCAFVPRTPKDVQCMRLRRGRLKFRLSTRFSCRLPFPMVIFTFLLFFHFLPSACVRDRKYLNCMIIKKKLLKSLTKLTDIFEISTGRGISFLLIWIIKLL